MAKVNLWEAFLYLFPLALAIARLKASGGHGTFRTKLVAEGPDGQVFEVPFVSITL